MLRPIVPLVLALAVTASTDSATGGWAVVTVEALPDYAVAGKPLDITYSVRQHGQTLRTGLGGWVAASSGQSQVSAAPADHLDGRYSAQLTLPKAGEWTITISNAFGEVKLYPISAIADGGSSPARLPQLTPAQRGQRLFVAKGCFSCHVHGAVEGSGRIAVGPDLTPRRYQADYLAKFLADPSIARTSGQRWPMPNLGLKPAEITSLVAFINSDRIVSAR